ncbi:inner membrane protein YiaA [Cupriavidus sp. NPDC089707]|uniref:inner membrane protein YiaA n=1 Tax=Cupriavidus sp. NPDC089707 TaxID=3363963 RepID=UPI003816C259
MKINYSAQQPSFAFVAASWAALLAGFLAFLVGLFNADMQLNEKGYYFTVLVYGLFAAVSAQKSVRDKLEGIPVTGIYYGLSWMSVLLAVLLLCIGLFNATLALSEKGFYAMSFALALLGAIAVQKNTRDVQAARPMVVNADAVCIADGSATSNRMEEA